jgi:hypothetical protein
MVSLVIASVELPWALAWSMWTTLPRCGRAGVTSAQQRTDSKRAMPSEEFVERTRRGDDPGDPSLP